MNKEQIMLWIIVATMFFILIFVSGCTSVVKVPIAEPCKQTPQKPIPPSPLASINDNSTLSQVSQAYLQDSQICRAWRQ